MVAKKKAKPKMKDWHVTVREDRVIEYTVRARTEREARREIENGNGDEEDSSIIDSDITDIYQEVE